MIKFILSVVLIFLPAYSYDIDKLLEDALAEIERENTAKYYDLALRSFNEGLYTLAIKNGELFLEKNSSDKEKIDTTFLLLAVSYFRTGNTKGIFDLYLRSLDFDIKSDIRKKMFVYTNNLLVRKKEWKRLKIVRKKSQALIKKRSHLFKLSGDFASFEPGINIFRLKKGNIIGENEIFLSDRNLTLIEIAKMLDMGYDELKIANPHIDPFDIIKGEAIFIPRKRLLPDQDFQFGTIYINLSEKRLYYPVIIDGDPYVITFPVGIGTDNAKSPVGEFKITQKKENPEWIVPKSIREEDPTLPPVVPPGPDNPLGVRAMRLGYTDYLLHGTSKRFGIGMQVSHGCIRMYNRDVVRLFNVVKKGTKVVITEKRYKVFKDGKLFIEIFDLTEKDQRDVIRLLHQKGKDVTPYFVQFISKEKRGFAIPLN